MEFDFNYLTVLGAAFASFGLGALWYSPVLFAKPWMKEMGIDPSRMQSMKLTPTQAMVAGFVTALVTAYVLAHFVEVWAQVTGGQMGIAEGFQLAFYLWLGFVAPVMLGSILWEGKSWKLFFINAGYQLVALLLMSGILSYFR